MTLMDLNFALRNVFRQGIRSAMPLFVVILATVVIVLIGGIYEFMFASLERDTIRSQGHIWLEKPVPERSGDAAGGPFLTQERFEYIANLPGVRVAAPRQTISGLIGAGEHSSIFSGRAIDPTREATLRSWGEPFGNGIDAPSEALVGTLLAKSLGLNRGDWFSGLAGDLGFSARFENSVQTESEELDRFYLELPFSALGPFDVTRVDSLHIGLDTSASIVLVVTAIQELFAKDGSPPPRIGTYYSPEGYISAVRGIYGNNLGFIMIVIAITVFFAIAAAFTMAITERAQELGTMRSFGTHPNHLTRLFQVESLFITLLGFLGGLAMAAGIGMLINLAGGVKLPPPPTVYQAIHVGFVFPPFYALVAGAIVVVVGQVSSLIVTHRVGRMSIIRQLGLNR